MHFPGMESLGPADDEQAQDLKELLLHWSRRETAVFANTGTEGNSLPMETRSRAVHLLRLRGIQDHLAMW